MAPYMTILTHGDPLGTIRKVVATVWGKHELDGVIAPVVNPNVAKSGPRLLEHLEELEDVNPFHPLMVENLVRELPDLLAKNPEKRLGVLLRPCELRALQEVEKRKGSYRPGLVTICVDCLGTYPIQDYEWRTERKGWAAALGEETLQFARQGGVAAYRYRAACQTCLSPGAEGAMINVGVIGLAVREHILVEITDPEVAGKIRQNGLKPQDATDEQVREHLKAIEKVIERQKHTCDQMAAKLDEHLPRDVDEIIAMLEACEDCDACIQACPICAFEPPVKDVSGRYSRQSVLRWMASCAGCGMCEQSCPDQVSLNLIFRKVRSALVTL